MIGRQCAVNVTNLRRNHFEIKCLEQKRKRMKIVKHYNKTELTSKMTQMTVRFYKVKASLMIDASGFVYNNR